jgi:hypothetical protein
VVPRAAHTFDPKAGPGQYLVYATRDLDFELAYGPDDV